MKRNVWRDGIYGVVVGDALGDSVQFMSRNDVIVRGLVTGMEDGGPFNTPAGTWTDDSALTLALLASIADKKSIDLEDVMDRFVAWLRKGEYTPFGYSFDIGMTCEQAISSFDRNRDVDTCGRTGVYANGNGALMRIMPACLYYYEKQACGELSESEAVEGVIKVASLTHNHLRTNICNGIYYFMVKSILDGKVAGGCQDLQGLLQEGIDRGIQYFRGYEGASHELNHVRRLFNLGAFKGTDEADISSSGYVVHTLEAAVWSLINTDTYKDALLKAVNLGDDSDTVAAVTGGLAGLYYGYEAIPAEWLEVIQRKEWIEDMISAI